MGLDEVKKEIIANAKREADRIVASAEKEADVVFEQAKARALEEKHAAQSATERLVETLRLRETAAADFDARKSMLEAKREAIEEVMRRAGRKVAAWNDKKRADVVRHLVERAQGELDLAVVRANSKDQKHVQAQRGVVYEKADITAGIVGSTQDGRVTVDYSVDEMLRSVRARSLASLGKILFGDAAR